MNWNFTVFRFVLEIFFESIFYVYGLFEKRNELLMGFKSCAKVLDLDSGEQKGSTLTFDESSKTIWVEDYICVFSEKKAILYKDANVVFTAPSYPQTPVTAAMHENLFAIG